MKKILNITRDQVYDYIFRAAAGPGLPAMVVVEDGKADYRPMIDDDYQTADLIIDLEASEYRGVTGMNAIRAEWPDEVLEDEKFLGIVEFYDAELDVLMQIAIEETEPMKLTFDVVFENEDGSDTAPKGFSRTFRACMDFIDELDEPADDNHSTVTICCNETNEVVYYEDFFDEDELED